MFITRLILILLGLWLVRLFLGAWTRSRRRSQSRREPQGPSPQDPIPFDGANIREAEYEDVDPKQGERGAGRGQS